MRFKNGQISIFFVIALVILIGGLLWFSFSDNFKPFKSEVEAQKQDILYSNAQSVENYIKSCLESVAEQAIVKLGLQGGYVNLDSNIFTASNYNTTYLYFEGQNNLPTINEIENGLADYIIHNIGLCTDFSVFNNLVIEQKQKEARVKIKRDEIEFNLIWPITISVESAKKQIENFNINLKLDFMDVHEAVDNIVKATENHPYFIDNLLFISQNVSFIDYAIGNNGSRVYLIVENGSGLKNPYYFLFATKSLTKEGNQPPIIFPIPILKADVGVPFYYKINATDPEGTKLDFKLQSPLFDVDESSGIINFTPTHLQAGDYTLPLFVTDSDKKISFAIIELFISSRNEPPEIIVSNKTALIGEKFLYKPYVYDKDDYSIGIGIVEAPAGMKLENDTIIWIPTNKGNYTVKIQANDGKAQQQAIFKVEVI